MTIFKKKHQFRVGLTDKMVLIGFGLAAVYWVLDTIVSVFLSYDMHFGARLFGGDTDDLWPRLIVICLFVIFGSHAQYTINERKRAEEQSRRETATRERFQRLLSPDLAEMVVAGTLKVEKGGEKRNATVMFVDIRGFTAMSEHTPADEVLQMLNEYFEVIVDIVFRHEGTIDKYIGDAVMVIWGAPVFHADDALRAVQAAVDIQQAIDRFNRERKGTRRMPVKAGIGINTGALVAGYIGSSHTMSYSVVGDTVNTASRICDAAEAGQILISEHTFHKVQSRFEARVLEPLQVKGKFKPLSIYAIEQAP